MAEAKESWDPLLTAYPTIVGVAYVVGIVFVQAGHQVHALFSHLLRDHYVLTFSLVFLFRVFSYLAITVSLLHELRGRTGSLILH